MCVLLFFVQNCYGMDGNTLYQLCKTSIDVMDNNGYPTDYYTANVQESSAGACVGYIAGVNDGYELTPISRTLKPYCLEDNVNYNQELRIVVKYLNDNPQLLNLNGNVIILDALSNAFPCK